MPSAKKLRRAVCPPARLKDLLGAPYVAHTSAFCKAGVAISTANLGAGDANKYSRAR
jgi:hypothetical protein